MPGLCHDNNNIIYICNAINLKHIILWAADYCTFLTIIDILLCCLLKRVKAAIKEYESAISVLQAAQTKVADALLGKTGNYKRCLFTNAFPHLGTLTNTLYEVSSAFNELNGHFEDLKVNLSESIGDLMNQLVSSDPLDGKTTKRKMEKSADAFETKLISTLSHRKTQSASEVTELCDLRMESELARFDLVEKLNLCNCSKKWLLSQVTLLLLLFSICTEASSLQHFPSHIMLCMSVHKLYQLI